MSGANKIRLFEDQEEGDIMRRRNALNAQLGTQVLVGLVLLPFDSFSFSALDEYNN